MIATEANKVANIKLADACIKALQSEPRLLGITLLFLTSSIAAKIEIPIWFCFWLPILLFALYGFLEAYNSWVSMKQKQHQFEHLNRTLSPNSTVRMQRALAVVFNEEKGDDLDE